MNKLSQKRLMDKLIDAYVNWREASRWVSDAYGTWVTERGPGAAVSYWSYTAALDREERAADVYADLVRRAGQLPGSTRNAAERLGEPA